MSDEQIQIFISYARDDDDRPPGIPDVMGFVDFLHRQMNYKFKTSGTERPEIWRDVDNIYRGEQFWPKIQRELDKSALLLVVLSQNWMAREYCRKELDYFIECRRHRGEPIDERIIVVAKNSVELPDRPFGMQNSEGYRFYQPTGRQRLGDIEEFFVRGKPVDSHYWPMFDELCVYLLQRSKQLRRVKFVEPQAPPQARTIYVAKPASDMLDDYIGVIKELTDHGYNVVPKRAEGMPWDRAALDFIDAALAEAEASVHLLGEGGGMQPDGLDQKIVALQLARAGERAGEATATQPPFRRIIWAPKVFRHVALTGEETLERDPHDVVARFGRERASDEVIGADPGNFRQSLVRLLDQASPTAPDMNSPEEVAGISGGTRVFVLHHENDRPLARSLKKALWRQKVEALLPATDGGIAERNALDKGSIQRSDAIVVCWGNTSETWIRTQARQFENWRAYERRTNWEPRSVVLAPPPGTIKDEFKDDPPPSEIDRIVELNSVDDIPPEVVSKIVPRRHAGEP